MLTTEIKSMALTGNKSKQSIGGTGSQTSVTFRTPQQFVKKKIWNKNNRSKHNNHQTHQDLENIQQNDKSNVKQQNKKPVVAAKFYLSDKRPPKEIIVPPTKFLLGGNISDPLNLNSLQNETINSNNNTPVTTPRRSPISQQTPPKIDVIIPPNIHDPLNLLDPVDSVEYEKQLTSPMKRKTKSKHRNRKKKPKRRRLDSATTQSELSDVFSVCNGEELYEKTESENSFGSGGGGGEKSFENSWEIDGGVIGGCVDVDVTPSGLLLVAADVTDPSICRSEKEESCDVAAACNTVIINSVLSEREKLIKDLRLDLGSSSSYLLPNITSRFAVNSEDIAIGKELVVNCDLNQFQQQQQQQVLSPGSAIGNNGNRKRKSSEGQQQQTGKNKQFRRLDSMDKIVSPVVPQPGAWKRPPHFVPTGARKARNRTTSHSETDILSPVEERSGAFDDNSIRSDTPDTDLKYEDMLKGSISPSSRGTTSAIAGSSIAPNQELPKFRKDGYKFQYGNYDRYVGYRNLNEFMDVRLQVFQQYPEVFKGKDVLDIGCNVGHMAIAIGRNFAPKSILGIDIDKDLISRARKNLSMYVRIPCKLETNNVTNNIEPTKKRNHKKTKKVQQQQQQQQFQKSLNVENHQLFPISFPICLGEIKSTSPVSDPFPSPHPSQANQNPFPKNVFFRHTNYVLKDESLLNNDTPLYDVIICLSVTKWIHLNYGDSGLKLAFKRMFNQLRPGGKLILEAQNWASYKKKKNLTENIYNNYRTIEFFPDYFHEYLLSNEVGFSHSYNLGVPVHLNKGFCRPIQLYAKGDFTPNHIQWSDAHHPQTPYETYRGKYAWLPRPMNYPRSSLGGGSADTPRGNSGSYSCRQTPLYAYNPLETDYLPSYGGIESLNRHYVFASPLYQTVWSPPASLKTPSNRTPHARSVRESDGEDFTHNRHVYPPSTYEITSPNAAGGAFNSIREEADIEEGNGANSRHVYATNCESPVASPQTIDCEEIKELSSGGSDAEANGFSPYGCCSNSGGGAGAGGAYD